jgi:hypothetical protein
LESWLKDQQRRNIGYSSITRPQLSIHYWQWILDFPMRSRGVGQERQRYFAVQFRRWGRHSSTAIRATSSPNHSASSFDANRELLKLKAR